MLLHQFSNFIQLVSVLFTPVQLRTFLIIFFLGGGGVYYGLVALPFLLFLDTFCISYVIVNVRLFGLVFYICQLDQKLVRTSPMLHEESHTFIVLLLLCTCANHHECNNSDVTSTWCSAYVCIANWLSNKLLVTIWNETSELANQRFHCTRGRVYNKYNYLYFYNQYCSLHTWYDGLCETVIIEQPGPCVK